MPKRSDLGEAVEEFADADLGDARLDERLLRVARQLAVSPSSSFPELMQSASEREAFYRFCSNERVTLDGLLAPHVAQTCNRMERGSVIRIAHDTTSFVFRGDREGMGPIHMKGQGFFAHCALAITGDEERRPLGVLGALTYSNDEAEKRKGMTPSQQVAYWNKQPREKKRRSRWERLAKATSAVLPSGVEAIHLMDQEADDFFLLADLTANGLRFVVRGTGERLTTVANKRIRNVLAHQRGTIFRKVRLSPRSPFKGTRKSRPERSERDATLFLRWAGVELPRTWPARESKLRTLGLTVVHVYEPDPPDGLAPIEWYLLTNERVEDLDAAGRIVDHYRARWIIEEYFKALKTGCAVEKRQLETYDGLVRVLGLFLPIAWRLLALRSLAREPKQLPAGELFDKDELSVLRIVLAQRRKDHELPMSPNVREVMLAIAAIGGHIPNNGDPGWIVLGRGFQTFLDAVPVWRAARCDQS